MELKRLIFNAYYESLYDFLIESREKITESIKRALPAELSRFGDYNEEDFDAYLEAAVAFLDERLEMYNPFGFQYTFDNLNSEFAKKLELQLTWFDSSQEFESLKKAVDGIIEFGFDESKLNDYAGSLISRFGAFPDKSIIEAYNQKPAAPRLPDFILAQSIEQIIHA
jgi:hypothetical protein